MAKKSIAKNYIYNLIYQFLTMIVPLITTPYLSRVLGADSIGIYSYTLSIATYFILFGSLGVVMYGQREIAYVQDDKPKRSQTFYELVLMRFLTLGISMLIFYITFASHGEYNLYYKILLLEILANALDISWFFQGLEDFKKTVIRHIIVKSISVIAIFTFVKTPNDLVIYFLIYVLSTLLGNMSLWLYLPKYIDKINIHKLNIKKHIKPTISLFIPQIAMQVYTVLDKTMIGAILKDMSEVGNYEQSQKIVKVALAIVTSLGTVLATRIANTYANNDKETIIKYLEKAFHIVWLLGIPIMFGIMAISSKFVPWFLGNDFEKSKLLLVVGAPLVIAIGLNNVSGIQYLIPTKKQSIYTKSVIAGAIFNLTFNIIFIPILKSIGAIIASVMAEFIILLVQLYYIRKDFSLKIVYNNSKKCIISGILMFLIVFLVGYFMPANILTTIVQIFIGILIYFGILFILKEELFYDIINKIFLNSRKKVKL